VEDVKWSFELFAFQLKQEITEASCSDSCHCWALSGTAATLSSRKVPREVQQMLASEYCIPALVDRYLKVPGIHRKHVRACQVISILFLLEVPEMESFLSLMLNLFNGQNCTGKWEAICKYLEDIIEGEYLGIVDLYSEFKVAEIMCRIMLHGNWSVKTAAAAVLARLIPHVSKNDSLFEQVFSQDCVRAIFSILEADTREHWDELLQGLTMLLEHAVDIGVRADFCQFIESIDGVEILDEFTLRQNCERRELQRQ
jgi:hypothetical protein